MKANKIILIIICFILIIQINSTISEEERKNLLKEYTKKILMENNSMSKINSLILHLYKRDIKKSFIFFKIIFLLINL